MNANKPHSRARDIGNAALGELVNQFSNPYDFIRELVQNSLDSGTPNVDVSTNFEFTDTDFGVCDIVVRDYGDGMDEQIIDKRLTRLFSSSKENDRTNIGKFGIGFVSVFAIAPEGVLVRTSRSGQHWEVFFFQDRSFEKTQVDTPIDGTSITVFKKMHKDEYLDAVFTIRETLSFWCKHAEKEIRFTDKASVAARQTEKQPRRRRRTAQGERINQPMEASGFLPMTIKQENAEISLAFSMANRYGYYNQGLTLAEVQGQESVTGYEKFLGEISFKIKSPFLEHTLTRDTILKDEFYHKAMRMVVDAARLELVGKLVDTMEELAAKDTLTTRERRTYLDCTRWLYRLPRALDPTFALGDRLLDLKDELRAKARFWASEKDLGEKSVDAINRKIFRPCHGGGALTFSETISRFDRSTRQLLISDVENYQTRELVDHGVFILFGSTNLNSLKFFKRHASHFNTVSLGTFLNGHQYAFASIPDNALDPAHRELVEKTRQGLKQIGLPIRQLLPVNFLGDEPTSVVSSGCVVDDNIASGVPRLHWDSQGTDIAWNIPGSIFASLAHVYNEHPDLAVRLATRQLLLETVAEPGMKVTLLRESDKVLP